MHTKHITLILSKMRIIICILLMTIFCILLIVKGLWQHALVISVLFVLLIPSSMRTNCGFINSVMNILWFLLCTVSTFLLIQLTINASIHAVGLYRISINLLIIAIPSLILYSITGNVRFSTLTSAFLFLLYATIDYYVLRFRGREITPFDILSVRTAANVAAKFDFTPGITLLSGILIFAQLLLISVLLPRRDSTRKIGYRGFSLLLAFIYIVASFFGSKSCSPKHFGTAGAGINGSVLNFALQVNSLKTDPPEGYSLDAISQYAKQVQEKTEIKNIKTRTPDIIVIMDESFADLSVLGSDLRTNQEVTPFIDSLNENTVRGYALSSVFGGDTANSEYEFLTGNSMYFLPENTVPYQQYIKDETISIVSHLKKMGYSTLAMHPFEASGWMRTVVYPLMGFDNSIFIDGFPQKDFIREYISDSEMFLELEERYEQMTNADSPAFIFGVTMQNHGGYNYTKNDFQQEINLKGYQEDYPDAEQYLSLIHKTDTAVQQLIEYFSDAEREVVVVFFGDHLPRLSNTFYEEIHGGTFDTTDEEILQYKVPFFIWANFDIDERTIPCTSINYLSAIMFQSCKIAAPNYQHFLLDVFENIPAINSRGYYSQHLKSFVDKGRTSPKDTNDIDHNTLSAYAIVQYNSIFEKKENRDLFFFPE